MDPGTSKIFHEEEAAEEEIFDSQSSELAEEAFHKLLIDQHKRDCLARQRASQAVISKRRLHGSQVTEVEWEERQLCIPSGHHCGEIHSNAYAQVKKPLTEVIENPSGSRKSLSFLGAGYERMPQNEKLKSLYGLTLLDDVMSYNHQDNDHFSQVNHSNSSKVAIKRVSSDETLNEYLDQGFNKHVLGLGRSVHKGIKYRKSRENLEIRRRHCSMGSSVTSEELSHHPRRTMWRKFSNYQLGFNSFSEEVFQDETFPNSLIGYDDEKERMQEKRVRRSSVGDVSFKQDFCHETSNFICDHSIPSNSLVVNAAKIFMGEDFPSNLPPGEFGYLNKASNFGGELLSSSFKSSLYKAKYPVDGVADQCSVGKWSEVSSVRSGLSLANEDVGCEISTNVMSNIYPSRWNEKDILQTLSFTKPLGQLKLPPIYPSPRSAIIERKSIGDFPVRKWARQRCLPKIPQLWKEGSNLSSGECKKTTMEDVEPLPTSTNMAVIESDDVTAVKCPENEGGGDKEIKDETNEEECSSESKDQITVSVEAPSFEKNNVHEPSYLPLRLSMFPYVPPYVLFGSHDKKGPPVHDSLRHIAKWKLGKFTPTIVQTIIKNSGLHAIRNCDEYVGIWAKNLSPSGFSHIKESQKINHIPGGFYIGRKDSLCNNLKKMKNVYGNVEYYFVPDTYVLPGDIYFLKQEWDEAVGKKEETKWIVKPPAGARGTGVSVIHNWNQIPHNKPVIVQKYIENPYLIDVTKFDLRVYILITSVHPLRLYVYSEGLVRFASDTYSPDTSTLSDKYVHLTNYSVNKKSSRYMVNQDPTACQGHKWTLSSLWNYLKARKVNVDGLWKKIVDIAIKTFLSGESAITRCNSTYLSSNYPSYELFGLDILLDADLNPWLLEVNISPSLNTSSKLDMSVKGPMISELLNLVGYHLPPTSSLSPAERREIVKLLMRSQLHEYNGYSENKAIPYPGLLFDKRIYTKALSSEEKRKHLAFSDVFSNEDPYCDSILRILMPDDVRHLLIAEDELSQVVRFERVFPAIGMQKYYKFFSGPRYYNMLHEAWEKRYHKDRNEGIELLRELCRTRLHLRTPLSMSSLKFGAKSRCSKEFLAQRRHKLTQRIASQKVVSKKSSNVRIGVKTNHADPVRIATLLQNTSSVR